MLVTVQSETEVSVCALPQEVSGGHWLCDASGRRVAFANADKGSWLVTPAPRIDFASARGASGGVPVDPHEPAVLNLSSVDDEWALICRPSHTGDKTFEIRGFSAPATLSIGRSEDNTVCYPADYVSAHHAILEFDGDFFSVRDADSSNGVFVNGKRIPANVPVTLAAADVVVLLGLCIVIGERFISANNPNGDVRFAEVQGTVKYEPHVSETSDTGSLPQDAQSFFYPALRFARTIEEREFRIDAPPAREKPDETSLAMRIGPSAGMGLAAVLSAGVSVMMITQQGRSTLYAIPMIAMAIAMLTGSVLWPIISRRMEAKRTRRKETRRRDAYSQYLGGIEADLRKESALQAEILRENRVSPAQCVQHALSADAGFMSRTPSHHDYLELRLGIGDEPLHAKVRCPDERFAVEEDDLLEAMRRFGAQERVLNGVPIGYSLVDKPILGIVGDAEGARVLMHNLLVQVAALHAYSDVKIAVLCDEAQKSDWKFASYLPHCMDDGKATRFFAAGADEADEVGLTLERMLAERMQDVRTDADPREERPFFVLFCPSKDIYDRNDFVGKVLRLKGGRGFSVVACAGQMHELPKECRSVVVVESGSQGYLLDRDDASGRRMPLRLDAAPAGDGSDEAPAGGGLGGFARAVAAARLDVGASQSVLPERLGFLEMFGVANVEHLNVVSRWKESSAANTLAAPVGVDAARAAFMLNLHEDFHGPHGLIAGTTGSGKSEFIITYILSLALNFSPAEVAFVLIDYKGGGLANAFDNDRFHLPHLAGTITNLDGAAITRSLVSIKSELQRRQRLFNEAREAVGGENVDIYKYLGLYRQGKVSAPCPHLFIVADEFAELKQQEPEFMDELISAARIGRSLGVHLILATQKPSGVVNDQIWSNARFKVCLKVADEADSKEMIRRPDAAEITLAGRFFLMVGYSELFAEGQSGYSGVDYDPDASAEADKNASVDYVSDTGRVLLSTKKRSASGTGGKPSELVTVLGELCRAAAVADVRAQRLWLDPLPAHLTVSGLRERYAWSPPAPQALAVLAGECDDPAAQRQFPLRLDLLEVGNVVVYGTADSGAELVLKAALSSALLDYDARHLNAYVVDYGSQSFAAFADAPQVGDVILLNDDEKIERFFSHMGEVVAQRRSAFSRYGGSFARYCETNDDCPGILVVINGVAAFAEANPKLEEAFSAFVRDASQVGIRIIALSEGISGMRMRMRGYFRQVLACNLADQTDYVSLFGSMKDKPSPRGYGRGLIQMQDGLFEFQAAHVAGEGEDEYEAVCALCERLAATDDARAPSIPVAPSRLSAQDLARLDAGRGDVPFGVFHDSLSTAAFPFSERCVDRVAAQKRRDVANFVEGVLQGTALRGEYKVVLLDIGQLFAEKPSGCELATRKADQAEAYLLRLAQAQHAQDEPVLVAISATATFLGGLDFSSASKIKDWLRSLSVSDTVRVLVCDVAGDASCVHDDWFKAHSTNRDGLWVAAGVDTQTAINASYNSNILPASRMSAGLGYWIEAGDARLVHLVEAESEE